MSLTELTHLCFADDLMLFNDGSSSAIQTTIRVLQHFYTLSGLKLNPSKCELFCLGISEENLSFLQQISGFKVGKLPLRYLGVPLITSKLSLTDCKPEIDKITSRIEPWSAKYLSFDGRLQLINSMHFSIHNFWSSVFILPAAVIKTTEKRCHAFIWKGQESNPQGAKVK